MTLFSLLFRLFVRVLLVVVAFASLTTAQGGRIRERDIVGSRVMVRLPRGEIPVPRTIQRTQPLFKGDERIGRLCGEDQFCELEQFCVNLKTGDPSTRVCARYVGSSMDREFRLLFL